MRRIVVLALGLLLALALAAPMASAQVGETLGYPAALGSA